MQGSKILILDDSAIVRRAIASLASELGFIVVEASSVEAARTELSKNDITFLLCDDDLGAGMSGTDFIKTDLSQKLLIKILMSGNPMPNNLPRDVRFLSKPFTISQLEIALEI